MSDQKEIGLDLWQTIFWSGPDRYLPTSGPRPDYKRKLGNENDRPLELSISTGTFQSLPY